MPYNTKAIANWFLERAQKDSTQLDPMKLQKIIYFAHGWFLALTGHPLIDEHPQAWEYGPVIPSIYHQFKSFGRQQITRPATDIEPPENLTGNRIDDLLASKIVTPSVNAAGELEKFLEQIWKVYGKQSAVALSNLSHVAGGAWDQAYRAAGGKKNVDISDELIKAEFEAKKTRGKAA